jgi:hypothetical protein
MINEMLRDKFPDLIGGEEIMLEVGRDMIKDELKEHIRKRLDDDPELKQEFKDAIGMYFEAKVKQMYANMKLAKASAKLGIEMMPEPLQQDFKRELEKEISTIVEKMV